jgi:predicted metal-dependent hydrolase
VEIDQRPVSLRIRTSTRARNMLLSVNPADGGIDLVLPRGTPVGEGLVFVESRSRWLAGRLRALPAPVPFLDGAEIPVLGVPCSLRHCPDLHGGVWMNDDEILVTGRAEYMARRVTDWLRRTAKDEISRRAHQKAELIGQRITHISVRDTRTRWGGCTSTGRLSFSWRLLLAPPNVLDYVVAHEVAHLVEMNHSQKFWQLVGKITVDADRAKAWLTAYGQALYRYG